MRLSVFQTFIKELFGPHHQKKRTLRHVWPVMILIVWVIYKTYAICTAQLRMSIWKMACAVCPFYPYVSTVDRLFFCSKILLCLANDVQSCGYRFYQKSLKVKLDITASTFAACSLALAYLLWVIKFCNNYY